MTLRVKFSSLMSTILRYASSFETFHIHSFNRRFAEKQMQEKKMSTISEKERLAMAMENVSRFIRI